MKFQGGETVSSHCSHKTPEDRM